MATIDERVGTLEGRVAEHARAFTDLKTALRQFEERVDRRFEGVDTRFVQIDARFVQIDGRLTALDQKVDNRAAALSAEIAGVRREASTHFRWIVGMFLATIASIAGAFIGQ